MFAIGELEKVVLETHDLKLQIEQLSFKLEVQEIHHEDFIKAFQKKVYDTTEKILIKNQFIERIALQKLKEGMQTMRETVLNIHEIKREKCDFNPDAYEPLL